MRFDHQTTIHTDPDQLLRQYWPGEIISRTEFYNTELGWQIAAVGTVANPALLDRHDQEYWNLLLSCDEHKGQILITVK